MVCTIHLINFLLLVSTTLAVRSTLRREEHSTHRREAHQSLTGPNFHSSDPLAPEAATGEAGAAWETYPAGTFTSVTGTFTVPHITSGSGSVDVWVGIDGFSACGSGGILMAGVTTTLSGSTLAYDAWYEWYPDYAYDLSGLSVSAGNVITVTVSASSTTGGQVIIENVTAGKTVTKSLTSTSALCRANAEWIVEDSGTTSLVPFSTINITNAEATTTSGSTIGPSGATLLGNEGLSGVGLFKVTTGTASVTVVYVG